MMIWSLRRPDSIASSVDRYSRQDHALVDDLLGVAEIAVGVLLHLGEDELLVERAAVDADADGLALVPRHGADRRKLLVAPSSGPDVARIDAMLVERLGAGRIASEAGARCSGSRR